MSISNKISNMGIHPNSDLYINRLFEAQAEVVNPEEFGAVGDGATDDTAAFQAALATGKTVSCDNKAYVVKELSIGGNQTVEGHGTRFLPVGNSRFVFELSGFGPTLKNVRIDDPFEHVIVKNVTTAFNAPGASVINVSPDASRVEVGMTISLRLTNGKQYLSVVTLVSGNDITIRDPIDGNCDEGSEVNCFYGLVKVGNNSFETSYPTLNNLLFSNCSSAIYVSNESNKGTITDITIGDVRYCGLSFNGQNSDYVLDNIKMYGGVEKEQFYTGDGATTVYDLKEGVNFKGDLSVFIDGVSQERPADWDYNTFKQIQFTSPPANNSTIRLVNELDGAAGIFQDNTNTTAPYLGEVSNILCYNFDVGFKLIKGSASFQNITIATVGACIVMRGQGTSVPLAFNCSFISNYSQSAVYATATVFNASFSGFLYAKAAPASSLFTGVPSSFIIDSGSTVSIERECWGDKDTDGDNRISNSGTLNWTGGRSILGINGDVTNPSISFGQDTTTGFYRENPGVTGVSGNLFVPLGIVGNKDDTLFFTFSNAINCTLGSQTFKLFSREGGFNNIECVIISLDIAGSQHSFEIDLPGRVTNFTTVYSLMGFASGFDSLSPGSYLGDVSSIIGTTRALVTIYNGGGSAGAGANYYDKFYIKYKAE